FTRVELAMSVGAFSLLCLITLPLLGNTNSRAGRVTCLNNLRQIGQAEQVWANDHRDKLPWRVDFTEGGSQRAPLQNQAWFSYSVMTNELGTPAILACPSDTATRAALDFSFSPATGFFSL